MANPQNTMKGTGTGPVTNTGSTSFQSGTDGGRKNQPGSDNTGGMVGTITEKAGDIASNVADKARDIASGVSDRITGTSSSVGGGMKSLAETIRENAPDSGMFRNATDAVADTLESGGRYLQEEGFTGIGQDLTNLVRRNPIPALLVGVAVGFLIARATTSDRS